MVFDKHGPDKMDFIPLDDFLGDYIAYIKTTKGTKAESNGGYACAADGCTFGGKTARSLVVHTVRAHRGDYDTLVELLTGCRNLHEMPVPKGDSPPRKRVAPTDDDVVVRKKQRTAVELLGTFSKNFTEKFEAVREQVNAVDLNGFLQDVKEELYIEINAVHNLNAALKREIAFLREDVEERDRRISQLEFRATQNSSAPCSSPLRDQKTEDENGDENADEDGDEDEDGAVDSANEFKNDVNAISSDLAELIGESESK